MPSRNQYFVELYDHSFPFESSCAADRMIQGPQKYSSASIVFISGFILLSRVAVRVAFVFWLDKVARKHRTNVVDAFLSTSQSRYINLLDSSLNFLYLES